MGIAGDSRYPDQTAIKDVIEESYDFHHFKYQYQMKENYNFNAQMLGEVSIS